MHIGVVHVNCGKGYFELVVARDKLALLIYEFDLLTKNECS